MKIKITQKTLVTVLPGQVVDVTEQEARRLLLLGRAEPEAVRKPAARKKG